MGQQKATVQPGKHRWNCREPTGTGRGRTLTNAACVWLPIRMYLLNSETDPIHRLLASKAHSLLLKINRGAVPFGQQVTDYFWTRMLLLTIPLLYLWDLLMTVVPALVNSLKSLYIPTWKESVNKSAHSCRWPCFGRGVGLDDPQRSLPTPNILWFCDSVIPFRGLVLLIASPQQEL